MFIVVVSSYAVGWKEYSTLESGKSESDFFFFFLPFGSYVILGELLKFPET